MNKIGLSKQECIEALQYFIDAIDKITELLREEKNLYGNKRSLAQERLKVFKEEIKDEYKIRSTIKSQSLMSSFEKHFYTPAIQEARTRVYVKTNSIPNQKWALELYDAQSSLKYYLHQLQNDGE